MMHLIVDTNIGSITTEEYYPVILNTNDKSAKKQVECRYYKTKAQLNTSAVIFIGGVGGGWDSPSRQLYPRLSHMLVNNNNDDNGISSLRVKFRYSTDLDKSIADVIAGIEFLVCHEKISSIGLVGHSFGGAVVISSAANVIEDPSYNNVIKTVVTLATQSYGTEGVSKLKEGQCSILLIHGNNDNVLSSYCSSYIYKKAKEPKHLVLFDNASHGLDEVSEQVFLTVYPWILENLNRK
jgi:pimeloyl-ACP methyl ester carboxylesterase